ncbi:MAG: LeuA family protein [Candidatus Aenigmatarchaeota archaeon]
MNKETVNEACHSRFVSFRDETLRDGIQQPGINLSERQKIEIAMLSARLLRTFSADHRNQIDLGMPEVSQKAKEVIIAIADEIIKNSDSNVDLFVTGRSTPDAIESMCEALHNVPSQRRIIAPFIGISSAHREKLGLSKFGLIQKIESLLINLTNQNNRIHFPLEGGYDAYIEDPEYVNDLLNVLQSVGIEAVILCDTVGRAVPFGSSKILSYGQVVKEIKERHPKIKVAIHCHDDLGLAVANSLEGVINGAEIVDGTFFGIGERSGNASLQTLITLLNIKGGMFDVFVLAEFKEIYPISMKIKEILQVVVADNCPVVGRNSFSHSSGIHQDGVLKDPSVYQPYDPSSFGRQGHEIVLSYLSGKSGIQRILEQNFGIYLNPEELDKVVKEFKERVNNCSPEQDLLDVINKLRSNNC